MKKQITLERTLTGFWLTILTSLILFATSCASTQNIHTYDIYKHNKKNLYNDCYTFAKK